MLHENSRWVLVFVLASVFFSLLVIMILPADLLVYDVAVLGFFAEQISPARTSLFRFITWAGSIYVLAPVAGVIAYLLVQRQRRTEAKLLLSSLLMASLLSRVLKYFIARERPDRYPALVDTVTDLAFPSVHAAQISTFCLALFFILYSWPRGRRAIAGIVLLGLVFGVICSRLYLQVHYLTDVMGGMLLGIACVAAAMLLYDQPRVNMSEK